VVGSMVDQRALSITGTVWAGTGKLRENRTEGRPGLPFRPWAVGWAWVYTSLESALGGTSKPAAAAPLSAPPVDSPAASLASQGPGEQPLRTTDGKGLGVWVGRWLRAGGVENNLDLPFCTVLACWRVGEQGHGFFAARRVRCLVSGCPLFLQTTPESYLHHHYHRPLHSIKRISRRLSPSSTDLQARRARPPKDAKLGPNPERWAWCVVRPWLEQGFICKGYQMDGGWGLG
jgi:hypothetical protein